jgi:hypothetical protein
MVDTPATMAAALIAAGAKAVVETRTIVQKGALNIKTEGRNNVLKSAPVHNAHAAHAITYDTKIAQTTVEAEIGYDKDKRGGKLGNLLEYGGGGDRSPAHRDLGRALDAEEPRFENAIALMATGLLN